MLEGAVVIHDKVPLEVLGHAGIDVAQEAQELLTPMARLALGEDRPLAIPRAANSVVVPWRT
jgi:hypothetical protein